MEKNDNSDSEKIPSVPQKSTPEFMADVDRLSLALAKSNSQNSLVTAEKFLVQSQLAEANFKYLVLQLYMKYGLTQNDTVNSETGEIIRGGVALATQGSKNGS